MFNLVALELLVPCEPPVKAFGFLGIPARAKTICVSIKIKSKNTKTFENDLDKHTFLSQERERVN